MNVVVERCAFLDVHRDTVMACARTPDGCDGGRREEVTEFRTTTSQLLLLAAWLVEREVTLVGMEATGGVLETCPLGLGGRDRGGVGDQRPPHA